MPLEWGGDWGPNGVHTSLKSLQTDYGGIGPLAGWVGASEGGGGYSDSRGCSRGTAEGMVYKRVGETHKIKCSKRSIKCDAGTGGRRVEAVMGENQKQL